MYKIAAYNAVLEDHPLWTKVAAPRQIKEIRRLVQQGDIPGARRLTSALERAGVLKSTPQGTQIRHLGSGAEGVGTLVVGAKDAPAGELAVRKAYDRGSAIFDRRNLAEKHNIMRRAKNHPNFAKTYSSKIRKGKGGTPYTVGEFVEGVEDASGTAGGLSALTTQGKGATDFSGALGMLPGAEFGVGSKKILGDVVGNPGNTIITPQGPKIIDVIPGTLEGAKRYASGTSPTLRRQQRLLGIREHRTVPDFAAAQNQAQETIQMLQNNPDLMNKALQVGQRRNLPTAFKDLYGIGGMAPSDVGAAGLRRASRRRALSGL